MDPVAGTLTIRSTGARGSGAPAATSLVFGEGASTVTISSASVQRVANGCAAGSGRAPGHRHHHPGRCQHGLRRRALRADPGHRRDGRGGLQPPPRRRGSMRRRGSGRRDRPHRGHDGARDLADQDRVRARTTFTGRIVGCRGPRSPSRRACPSPRTRARRALPPSSTRGDRMAYVAKENRIVYVNLDGTAAGSTIALPESGRSLAFQVGADRERRRALVHDQFLRGVVYQGAAIPGRRATRVPTRGTDSAPSSSTHHAESRVVHRPVRQRVRAVERVVPERAVRTVDEGPHGRHPAVPWTPSPFGIAIAPPRSASGSTDPYWIYVIGTTPSRSRAPTTSTPMTSRETWSGSSWASWTTRWIVTSRSPRSSVRGTFSGSAATGTSATRARRPTATSTRSAPTTRPRTPSRRPRSAPPSISTAPPERSPSAPPCRPADWKRGLGHRDQPSRGSPGGPPARRRGEHPVRGGVGDLGGLGMGHPEHGEQPGDERRWSRLPRTSG